MANIDEVYELLTDIDLKLDSIIETQEDQSAILTDLSSRLFELEMPTGGGFELES